MPKTGSQTIEQTVRHYCPQLPLLRVHFLSDQNAGMVRKYMKKKGVDAAWKHDAELQAEWLNSCTRSLRARRFLVNCGFPLRKLNIITAVREVLGAALSSLFENYKLFVPQFEHMSVEICRDLLMKPKFTPQFQNWFDDELRPFCGVNVYSTPFTSEQGYALYTSRYARVLLYKFENFAAWRPALEQFLGILIPELVNRNIGSDKAYASHYQKIKKLLKLPAAFVEQQLSTTLMGHFYSRAEREGFSEQWSEDSSSANLAGFPHKAPTPFPAAHAERTTKRAFDRP